MVVVPCYKQAEFLPDAVESACAQTHEDLEIVIVNDGSPDATSDVARTLVAAHPERRIRLIEQLNQGLPAARNRGIESSEAEYIVCLDADDKLATDYIARCVRALREDPRASIAHGDHHTFGAASEMVLHDPYDFVALTQCNRLGVASMFRRRAWEEVGGYNEAMCSRNGVAYEDWDFWLGCAERGHFGTRVPLAVFYYRIRPGSMYAGVDDQRTKAAVVLNHPVLYSPQQLSWARGVIDREPAALAIAGPPGHVPHLGTPPAAPLRAHGMLEGARTVTVLALASELRDDDALARTWCETFGAADDITLALLGDEPALSELGARMNELAAGGDPDLLGIVTEDPARDLVRACTRADALLTHSVLCLPTPLPRYRAVDVGELRRACDANVRPTLDPAA